MILQSTILKMGNCILKNPEMVHPSEPKVNKDDVKKVRLNNDIRYFSERQNLLRMHKFTTSENGIAVIEASNDFHNRPQSPQASQIPYEQCDHDGSDWSDSDSFCDPDLPMKKGNVTPVILKSESMFEVDPVYCRRKNQFKSLISNLKLEVEFTNLAATRLCALARFIGRIVGVDQQSCNHLESLRRDIESQGVIIQQTLNGLLIKMEMNKRSGFSTYHSCASISIKNDD